MGFEKIQIFPRAVMHKVGNEHVTKAFNRIFIKGQDGDGHTLKKYTQKYAEKKSRRMTDLDGQRYAAYRGRSISSTRTFPPDLTLTGTTRRDLRFRGYAKDFYTIGWMGESAQIIKGQKDQGRNIIDSIPQKELDWVRDRLVHEMDVQFNKKIKDITITIG